MNRLVLTIFLLSLPAPAYADSPARIKAREHFERGETQYRLGRFSTALKEYQAALKLVRRPSIVFNIAQCYRQLGEYRRSIFYYKLYLSDWQRVHPGQKPPYEREVKEHVSKLTATARRKAAEQDGPGVSEPPGPAAARVQLDGAPDGARVFVDGVLVARTPLEVPLQLTPGQHRLELVARGAVPWVQNIQLSGSEQRRILVEHVFKRVSIQTNRIRFQLNLAENLPVIHVNEYVIWEILEPLIQNSIDHAGAAPVQIDIQTTYDAETGQTKVILSDTGPGIRSDLLEEDQSGMKQIFRENVSTKEAVTGSGYGCYIAYEIATTRCGWTLDAENQDQGGSRFILFIPGNPKEKTA